MTDELVAGRNSGPEIIELNSVPGFVVFDLAGAPGAFETLRTPGEHGKILVTP